MIKFRVMVLGKLEQGNWKLAFDSYKEAKEYGDFLVGCTGILDGKPDEGILNIFDPESPKKKYLIVAEEEEGEEGRWSA